MNKSLVVLAAAGVLAGCASSPTPPPTIQTGPDAEVTVDGLYRVDNSVVALAYMKPDMDLSGYTALMIDPVTVAYQTDPRGRTSDSRAGTGSQNFALNGTQMESLKEMFQVAVTETLSADSGYRIVDMPGPDVLRVTAELIDLIIRVPTQQTAGRSRAVTRSYGAVTLVLELRDSQSGEIIARAADRRDPTSAVNGEMVYVTPAFVRADMRRLFEFWAGLLRERLDALRGVEAADPAQ